MKNSLYFKMGIIVFILLFTTQLWTQNGAWEYLEPMPEPRAFGSAAVLESEIYIIGGLDNESSEALMSVLRFDPITGQWDTNVADLPIPLSDFSASVLNGKIYVTGGQSLPHSATSYVALASVFQYDPLSNTWIRKADMNRRRVAHQSVVLDDKIFVMGGAGLSVEMYSPKENSWTFIDSMNIDRGGFRAEVVDGRIYVLGGGRPEGPINDAEVYNPETGTWSILEDIPEVLTFGGSAVVDNQILLFGGLTVKIIFQPPFSYYTERVPTTNMWMWDSDHNWDTMSVHMPDTMAGFAYAQLKDESGNDCIYAFGGTAKEYWESPYFTSRSFSNAVRRYCFNNSTTRIADVSAIMGEVLKIYPNPVHTNATIQYTLNETSEVIIKIFDVSGHHIMTVLDAVQPPGKRAVNWNVEDLAVGIYYCTLQTKDYSKTKKCVVLY